jgi:hypothetical protein
MAYYIRWPEWIDDQDQAYIYCVTSRWIDGKGIPELLDRFKARPDVVERMVVNCALLSLAVALKLALKKLRRGEAIIPFNELRMAATGRLRCDLIQETWKRLGKGRGMSMPLAWPWQLRPQVEDQLDSLPWQRTIKSLLEKIALVAAQPPKAESGPRATTSAAAASESETASSRPAVSQRAPGQPRKTVTGESQFIEDLFQRLKAEKGCEQLTKDKLLRTLQKESGATRTSYYDFLSGALDPGSSKYRTIARVLDGWKNELAFRRLARKLGAR